MKTDAPSPTAGMTNIIEIAPDLPVADPAQVELIAAEVILRVARQAHLDKAAARAPKEGQIIALADALMARADRVAEEMVRDARLRGMEADALYRGLVAPAVARVGAGWAKGDVALHDMVRASNRIWRILRDLREVFVTVTGRIPGREAVFALCPEEIHTIGLTMTADDLRRRGWDVELVLGLGHDELVARLDALSPATVALAATTTNAVLPLARAVVALRAHLPGVWIMVGGAVTEHVADVLAQTGADAVANTADEAERLMLGHIADMAERRSNRG